MKRDIGDIIDRWSIAKLKAERIGTDEAKKEYKVFCEAIDERTCDKDKLLKDMMISINDYIWQLEAGLKGGKDEIPNKNYIFDKANFEALARIGVLAILVRNLNSLRISLKNYINELYGEGFQDSKKDHLSENNNKTE